MDNNRATSVRPRYATIPQGSDYLGLSRATLYAERKAGRLKFVKFGNATRVEYDELDRYANEEAKAVAI